jgi:hypothetical protein
MLTFSLPTKRASQRVEIWRMLQRYGAVPLGNSGYLLPNSPANLERFEWLATSIRKYTGDASVVKVHSIDNLSTSQLSRRFNHARDKDYEELIRELQKFSSATDRKRAAVRLARLRSRFREIVDVDFFHSPLRKRVDDLLRQATVSPSPRQDTPSSNPRHYVKRLWVTRPRPGIDRSASAWVIRRFIDKKARFTFAFEDTVPPDAVPFDMFHGGFGHRGEDCTFETLQKEFRIRDEKVSAIAEMIHDADLCDGKFGRKEAFGVDEVLKGWAHQGWPDPKILESGIEMIEGLYHSLS